MRNHCNTFIGAALLVIAAAFPVAAQAPSSLGLFGFYDAATGAFRPVPLEAMPSTSASEAQPRAKVSRRGRIRIRIIINVKNGSDPSFLPSCQGSVTHAGVRGSYSESMSVAGTRTGDTAECIIVINYFWPHADTDNPVNLFIFTSISSPSRSSSQNLGTIPLPANGELTTRIVEVTL